MENSADRFFKGFSLEGYRLQVLVDKLEKEKKQCLNRLREETHVFKMSVRAPVKCGDDCWSQYGEIFHANGDKRENASITHINTEHNKDENSVNRDAVLRDGNTSHSQKSSSRLIKIPSKSLELHTGVNQAAQRSYLQRMRDRNNNRKKNAKKREKSPGLTLLEILCADFENGALLAKKEQVETDTGHKNGPDKLGRKHSKKMHITQLEKKQHLSDIDKSVPSKGNAESNARSRLSKSSLVTTKWRDGDTAGDSNSSISSRSKSVDFQGRNSADSSSLQISPISERCLSSQESIAVQQRPSQNANWTFKDTVNNCQLGETGMNLRTDEPLEKTKGLSASSFDTRMNDETVHSSHIGLPESCLESQNTENSRFVHFKEGRIPSRRNVRRETCGDRSKGKEKMNRARSSGVKLFQVEGLQNSTRRKSQDEVDKETRQKMDQFFTKVERTKCFQTSKQRWRCSSGVELTPRRSDRKTCLEPGKRFHEGKKEHGYRRAQPWPTQVWS